MLLSLRILCYLYSVDLSKSFPQLCQYLSFANMFSIDFAQWNKFFPIDCANIYLFSIFFFNRFCTVEKCGVTQHCLHSDSLTLIG